MSTYASVQDVKDYVDGNGIQLPSDARIQTILDRAERDIDWIAGSWQVVNTTTGRKFDPSTLPAFQSQAVKFATCAQVEYRLLQGESFMAKAQHQVVRFEDTEGAEFRTGQLPYIGPKVHRELALGGLVRSADVQMVSMGPRGAVSDVIGNVSCD